MRFAYFLALGLLAACAGEPSNPASGDAAASTYDLPIIEVASAESLVADLDGLEAEAVVLNFWATWCGPCRQEFPAFRRFDAEMESEGVHVRFVSLDNPDDRALIEAFLAEQEVDDPSYLYTGTGDLTSQLNPFVGGALPITMVLDGDGIVHDTHVGMMTYDELTESVAAVRASAS